MNVWPWSTIRRLRRDVHAARRSCSANARKANRLAAHIRRLDRAIARRTKQASHDQAYIDALEERSTPHALSSARAVVADMSERRR